MLGFVLSLSEVHQAVAAFASREIDLTRLLAVAETQIVNDPTMRQSVIAEITAAFQAGDLSANDLTQVVSVLAATTSTIAVAPRDEATVLLGGAAEPEQTVLENPATQTTRKLADHPRSGQTLRTGDVLNRRFELEESVGEGGMGVVFKARDRLKVEANDRDPYVALKVLSEGFSAHRDSLIAMQREARNAQKLSHPNVVRVHDFSHDDESGHYFIVMEYLRGNPLDTYMRSHHNLRFDQVWRIIEGTGLALSYAHAQGIIHSDIKPGNIWITDDGSVKLLDFGIARAADPDPKTQFQGIAALSMAYAAPEMHDRAKPDPRDDIYALACVAYELISGEHPFKKESAVTARDKGLVPKRPAGLKPRQWRALEKALSFERANRTGSVDTFLREFAPQQTVRPFVYLALAALVLVVAVAAAVAGFGSGLFGGPAADPEAAYVSRLLDESIVADLGLAEIDKLIQEGQDFSMWGSEDLLAGEYQRGNSMLKHGVSTAFRPFYTALESTRDLQKRQAAANGILDIHQTYAQTVARLIEADLPQKALWLTCQGLISPTGTDAPRWHELESQYEQLWQLVKGEKPVPVESGCTIEKVPTSWGDAMHLRGP